MRRVRLITGFAFGLFASVNAQSASGTRIIEVLSDWGTSVAQGKIVGYPSSPNSWVQSYQGPLLSFPGLSLYQSVNSQPGGLHSINAQIAPVTDGAGWSCLKTGVAVVSGSYTSYGRAEAHFNVNFRVVDDPVPFLAGADMENGTIDYSLYDVTTQTTVFDWHYSGSGAGYSNFTLLPGHTYWMSLNSRAEAQGTSGLMAQGIYKFDAVFMPEPTTLFLLAGLALLGFRRK